MCTRIVCEANHVDAPLSILIHTWISEREFLKERTVYLIYRCFFIWSVDAFDRRSCIQPSCIANMNPFDWNMFLPSGEISGFYTTGHSTDCCWYLCPTKIRRPSSLCLFCLPLLYKYCQSWVLSQLCFELWAVVCIFIGAALSFPTQNIFSKSFDTYIPCCCFALWLAKYVHVPWERQRIGTQK